MREAMVENGLADDQLPDAWLNLARMPNGLEPRQLPAAADWVVLGVVAVLVKPPTLGRARAARCASSGLGNRADAAAIVATLNKVRSSRFSQTGWRSADMRIPFLSSRPGPARDTHASDPMT